MSSALTSLPEGLTSIGDGAFSRCTNLALTSLPEGLTSIGGSAFSECRNLTFAITSLPEGFTTLGGDAFYLSSVLFDITYLPASLTSIGPNSIILNKTTPHIITCYAVTPPTVTNGFFQPGKNIFGLGENPSPPSHISRIEVPAGSVEAYKAAEGWSLYADRIFAIE